MGLVRVGVCELCKMACSLVDQVAGANSRSANQPTSQTVRHLSDIQSARHPVRHPPPLHQHLAPLKGMGQGVRPQLQRLAGLACATTNHL